MGVKLKTMKKLIYIFAIVIMAACSKEPEGHIFSYVYGTNDGSRAGSYTEMDGHFVNSNMTEGTIHQTYSGDQYDIVRGKRFGISVTNHEGIGFASMYLDGKLMATDTTSEDRPNIKIYLYCP